MPFLCVTPSLPFTLNVSTISCASPWNLPRGRLQDDDFLRKILKCVLKRMAGRNKFTTLHKSGGWSAGQLDIENFLPSIFEQFSSALLLHDALHLKCTSQSYGLGKF